MADSWTQMMQDEERVYLSMVSDGDNDRTRELDRRSPQSVINEIRGRYSVADLVEQTDEDLERGDELFYKSGTTLKVVEQGKTNLIDRWRIDSDGTIYEARRFKNFVWCSCTGFFYSRKMCKHLAMTAGVYCERCRQVSAKVGKLCYDCDGVVNRFKVSPAAERRGD